MLVEAEELVYDYDRDTISAVGNVKIYYIGYTLEADRVSYVKSTGKLIATGNVKMTDPSGLVVYANDIDITEDFRDGFVDSLRVETPDKTYFAAERAERTGGRADRFRQWRLHRLRALRGQAREAAALAGQGEADHRRRQGEDDLLPQCELRVLRPAARVGALHERRRPVGEAEDRVPGSPLRIFRRRWLVGHHALFHRARAELRPDPDAELLHRAGLPRGCRVAAPPGTWPVHAAHGRHRPAEPGELPDR